MWSQKRVKAIAIFLSNQQELVAYILLMLIFLIAIVC